MDEVLEKMGNLFVANRSETQRARYIHYLIITYER